jgi:hypothetical protein
MQEKIVPLDEELTPMKNIHQRMHAVMTDLDYIEKGDAKVNGQYRFVSHDQVTSKIHPLLVKHRLLILPSVHECLQENNRTKITLQLAIINIDQPGDYVLVQFPGYGIDSGDKGIGKAISYAYKYGLLKTFCLETGDDPDNDANASYEPPKCLEFESLDINPKDMIKMRKFLEHSAKTLNQHVEDVKREAMKRPEDFLKAFDKWTPKKKDE